MIKLNPEREMFVMAQDSVYIRMPWRLYHQVKNSIQEIGRETAYTQTARISKLLKHAHDTTRKPKRINQEINWID